MKFGSRTSNWLSRLVMTVSILVSVTAFAAPNLPDPANLPRIETQPSPPVIVSPKIEQKEDSNYPAVMSETSDIKVKVEHLKFTGNKNVSNTELTALLSPYLGLSLGIKELHQMTALVTRYYRQLGYMLAEAYLPEQDITQNTLEIAVVEGYLGELRMQSKGGLDEAFLKKMASRDLANKDVIRESNLVKNITLINSLPGIKAISELSPGADVGYSDVEIEVQALPLLTGYLGANTYGNRFTGRETLIAGLFFNNLAGRGDRLGLNLKDSNGERQRSAQVGYSVPIHESGTILNLNAGYSDYRLGGEFSKLDAFGQSSYQSVFLDQPVLRSRQGNITSRIGFSHKDISDDVSAFSLKNHRGINAIEFGLFGDWRDSLWKGFNQLGLNLKFAEVDLKNSLAQSLDDAGAKTAGNFVKYSLFGSRIQPLNPMFNLILRAEYQGTDKNLDSTENLAIGGINRWREFGELPTSSDRGLIAGIELRRSMLPMTTLASFLPILKSAETSPYAFFDYGRGIIDHSALSNNNHVNSAHCGIGIDIQFAKKWMLDLAASHQRSKVEGVDSESETRVWGQIRAEF
jgi:hemolysin activation/secretion protein